MAQIDDSHCGPAVLQMLLSFYNIEVTQPQVVHAAGADATVKRDGVGMHELAAAVQNITHFGTKKKEPFKTSNYLRITMVCLLLWIGKDIFMSR